MTGNGKVIGVAQSSQWLPMSVSPGTMALPVEVVMVYRGQKGQPPPAVQAEVSVALVVEAPVNPPAATRVFPTAVPAGNERATFSVGPADQVSEPGS